MPIDRPEPVLEVAGLATHFFTHAGVLKAVDGVDLRIGAGEVLGLVGESGSGKTITGFSILGSSMNPAGSYPARSASWARNWSAPAISGCGACAARRSR